KQGDDISANMKTVASLPLKLMGAPVKGRLEVRGEVFMPVEAFAALNQARAHKGEQLFANPRNAAGGSLKLLDPSITAQRNLSVVFYSIADPEPLGLLTQDEVHDFLKSAGFPTLSYRQRCLSRDEIWSFVEEVRTVRDQLPYQ